MHHPDDDNIDDDNIDDESRLAYSVPGFMRASSIGRSKTYDEIKRGRLKAVRIGGRTVIPVHNARRWLKSYEEAE